MRGWAKSSSNVIYKSHGCIYISTYFIQFWIWNVTLCYVVARVPDFEYLIVGCSSLFYCVFKEEKQDYRELSMDTNLYNSEVSKSYVV